MTFFLCVVAIVGWLTVLGLFGILSIVCLAYSESQIEIKTLQKSLEIAKNNKSRTKVWNTKPHTETA